MTPPSLGPWHSSHTMPSHPTRTKREPSASTKEMWSRSFRKTHQVGHVSRNCSVTAIEMNTRCQECVLVWQWYGVCCTCWILRGNGSQVWTHQLKTNTPGMGIWDVMNMYFHYQHTKMLLNETLYQFSVFCCISGRRVVTMAIINVYYEATIRFH